LSADGHRVELIDERFAIPSVGTALVLFPPAQSVLARLGVREGARAVAAAPRAGTARSAAGRRPAGVPAGDALRSCPAQPARAGSAAPRAGTVRSADGRVLAGVPAGDALLTSRSQLVRILLDALPGGIVTSTRRIEDVRPLREGADLLVGADGVHSLVRRSGWSGRARARSHGMTVLRGTTPLDPPELSETWGRGWLFGITPLAEVGTNWFACVPEHRTGSRDQDLAHLRRVVGGRRAPIDAVLEAATAQRTLVHGIHTAPPVWPVRENVVLLGDAAH